MFRYYIFSSTDIPSHGQANWSAFTNSETSAVLFAKDVKCTYYIQSKRRKEQRNEQASWSIFRCGLHSRYVSQVNIWIAVHTGKSINKLASKETVDGCHIDSGFQIQITCKSDKKSNLAWISSQESQISISWAQNNKLQQLKCDQIGEQLHLSRENETSQHSAAFYMRSCWGWQN